MRPEVVAGRPGVGVVPWVDLGDLGLDAGGHLLVDRALGGVAAGECLVVRGTDPNLGLHLRAWVRHRGHRLDGVGGGGATEGDGVDRAIRVVRGSAAADRWRAAQRAGDPRTGMVEDRASPSWGLAARGAVVEDGGPDLAIADLSDKSAIWSDLAPRLYAQAAAGQWDPATAIDWQAPIDHPDDVEDAVVQVMTYLVENEQAALLVPARFLGRIHPHYREALQFLAIQVADEARHIEVFTRRALLRRDALGRSGAGGRASLQTLLEEPEFAVASFLLSVLGEGTFLHLLSFLERHGPDPVTRRVCHLALVDESRHVAFGLAHLQEQLAAEPALRSHLATAVERRHDVLASTAGLDRAVSDALVVLAAGSWAPTAVAAGFAAVQALQQEMDEGRQRRLVRLGFSASEAAELSALHTRNFM
ncbi:MAG: hypothetical protein DLM54_07740 [Acidimicrobiales bacterium]|nr:MAG: hypothetical protein DLM54_07740 [Acidimicrobiales bacterium]